jgi:predicted metalloprotease with PDZ domain
MALDLTLRSRGRGKTLDDVMREMWRAHGVSEIPYEVPDVEAALGRVTDDRAFARDFFGRYVHGRESPDFQGLLALAGIQLAPAFSKRAWLGSGLAVRGGNLVMTGTPTLGSPLYQAGIDRGDRVLDIGGERISSAQELRAYLEDHEAGEVVVVRFESRGQSYEAPITLGADPTLAAELASEATSTAAERDFFGRWKAGS